jgi:hypothetical protein
MIVELVKMNTLIKDWGDYESKIHYEVVYHQYPRENYVQSLIHLLGY